MDGKIQLEVMVKDKRLVVNGSSFDLDESFYDAEDYESKPVRYRIDPDTDECVEVEAEREPALELRYKYENPEDIFAQTGDIDDFLRHKLGRDYSRIEVSGNEEGEYQTIGLVGDFDGRVYRD